MWSQMEMRNMLLGTEGEAELVIQNLDWIVFVSQCSVQHRTSTMKQVSNKIGYLAEEISKENVEGAACLLLNAYSKMGEERDDLKMELFIRTEATLKGTDNSQPRHTVKQKVYLRDNFQGVAKRPTDKAI